MKAQEIKELHDRLLRYSRLAIAYLFSKAEKNEFGEVRFENEIEVEDGFETQILGVAHNNVANTLEYLRVGSDQDEGAEYLYHLDLMNTVLIQSRLEDLTGEFYPEKFTLNVQILPK